MSQRRGLVVSWWQVRQGRRMGMGLPEGVEVVGVGWVGWVVIGVSLGGGSRF